MLAEPDHRSQPLELILARNLARSLSTPAYLVDHGGVLVFYNEAAEHLLGRPFAEIGDLRERAWEHLGPFDREGGQVPIEELPLTQVLRSGCPAHASLRIHTFAGVAHDIEVSALPILTAHGPRGALAFFWLERDASVERDASG